MDKTDGADLPTGRQYTCARCGVLVLVCSGCDRSRRYCKQGCSSRTRHDNHLICNRLHWRSPRGQELACKRKQAQRDRAKQRPLTMTQADQVAQAVALPKVTALAAFAAPAPGHVTGPQREDVTDQGSPQVEPHDAIPSEPNDDSTAREDRSAKRVCHFCGCALASAVRTGWLRHSKAQPFDFNQLWRNPANDHQTNDTS
jgi:hypothetical protein